MKGIELAGPVAQDGLRMPWDPRVDLPRTFLVPLAPVSLGRYLPKGEDGILKQRNRVFHRTDRVTRDGRCYIYVWAHDEIVEKS